MRNPRSTRASRALRTAAGLGAGLVTFLAAGTLIPGCAVGYVVKSAWFQAELLASREPIDKVRATGRLSEAQLAALDTIADVKAYGAEVGLAATDNYGTVALDWDRTIWNVTACDPVAFSPETFWFPIVGRVNYLGYFREQDARRRERRLVRKGLDVYVRTAGAYSTLGWFRDPVLVPMLDWSTFDLADTVLHELVHATVWIPGSVSFNESFANFVGEEAAFGYLDSRFGEGAEITVHARQRQEDRDRWRELLHELYKDLDAAYSDESLSPDDKRGRKVDLFDSLVDRVAAAGFHDPERYTRASTSGTWNNARMIQFRTYNDNRQHFRALLDKKDGDLLAFMTEVQRVTRGARDPFEAIEEAMRP